ncbi:hypothetical protein [Acinetobacter towneri]|uniref:hypothetical protein n=1 Tax=Acinetobacter towneri TaxID=202956 RepID=UPI00257583CB|nr:hypothetical protein [Acinetobacter towneri]MDM1720793.1 hypothetical protein [Acinetobacter towneri]
MNLIQFLNNKFSSTELSDLNISFYEDIPTGHHRDFLYLRTPQKNYKLAKMASSYFSFEREILTNHIEEKDEKIYLDQYLGCLVSKNVLEFKLGHITISSNYSWRDFLQDDIYNFRNHEITFTGENYSIFLTSKSFHNGLQILDIKEYKSYLSSMINNELISSLDDIFCQNSEYYFQVRSNTPDQLISEQLKNIDFKKKLIKELNSCTLQLAEKDVCLNLLDNYFQITTKYKLKKTQPLATSPISPFNFDEEAIAFYKLAKSSIYPSQKFLHFYHVLEFYFLQTSENELHKIIQTKLANPSFYYKEKAISEIINSVKKFDLKSDEEEKLRLVLKSSTENEALLNFIDTSQNYLKQKYSKSKKIFGKDISIRFENDHIIGNVSKVIKHLRNALVHSSDLYNREECYVPFSICEDIYAEFIELMDYLALNVLSANAKKI